MTQNAPDSTTRQGRFSLFRVRNQLIVFFLIAVTVPVFITLGVALNTSRTNLEQLIDEELQVLAVAERDTINELLSIELDILTLLGANDTIRNAVIAANNAYPATQSEIDAQIAAIEAEWVDITAGQSPEIDPYASIYEGDIARTIFAEFERTFPGHSEIILTDRYGAVVASSVRTDDYAQADESWWLRTYDRGLGSRYISDEIVFDSTTSSDGLRIAVPITNGQNNDVIGVLRAHYELDLLLNTLNNVQVGQTGAAFIVDADDAILLASENLPEAFSVENAVPNESGFGLQVDVLGEDFLVELIPLTTDGRLPVIDELGWQVGFTESEAEILTPVSRAANAALIPAAIILVLGAAAGILIALRTTQPLTALSDAAERIGRDRDWDARVAVTGNNEFGRLGNAFNTMAAELRKSFSEMEQRVSARTADLETASEIASAANQIRERDELISLTVNLIRDRFDFYYVQAYIIDDARQFAVLSEGTGYAGRLLLGRNHKLSLDSNSLVATAINTEKTVIVQNTAESSNWLANEVLPDTKSEIVIPLRTQNEIIGVLDIQHTIPDTFDESAQRLFETLADQLAVTFDNVNLLRATEERAKKLATVSEVSIEAATERDLSKMLLAASQLTRDNFNLYHAHIYLVDEQENRMRLVAGAGDVGREMVQNQHGISLKNNTSLVVQAVRTASPVIVNDITAAENFLPNPLLPGTRSEMAVPMVVAGRVLGVLDVQDDVIARFDDEDAQVLRILAAQLGVAVDNIQIIEQAERQRVELDRIFNSTLDMLGSATFEGYFVQLNDAWEATLGHTREALMAEPFVSFVHPEDVESTLAEAAKLADGVTVIEFTNRYRKADGSYIWVAWKSTPDVEAGLINFVARDITKQRETEREIQARSTKMESVTQISSEIAGILDIDELLWRVSELTKEMLNHYHAQIYLLSNDGKTLTLRAGSGQTGRMMVDAGHVIRTSVDSLVARAARQREIVIVNDVRASEDFLPNPFLPETRAEISIPIIYGNELLGVLDVQDSHEGVFGDLERQVKQTLSNQIATAIQNARQFQLTENRLQEVLATNAIANFTREEVDLELMLENVLTVTLHSLNAFSSVLSVYDQDKNEWTGLVGAGEGVDTAIAKTFIDEGERYPHGLEAVRTGDIVTVDNVLEYPDFPMDFVELLGIKSVVVIPITVNRQVFGVMFLNYVEPHPFTDDDKRLARSIAVQVSSGIERQQAEERIRRQTVIAQRRAAELETVANVSAASASVLDVQELLNSVVELTKSNFNFYHAHVYLYDEDNSVLQLAAGAGEAGQIMLAGGHQLAFNNASGLVPRAARSREVVVVNNTVDVEDFLPNPLLPDTKSEMAIPMLVGNELIGVLDIQSTDIDRFDSEDIRIQSTLASQIAVAVRNAQAFERERRTVERLKEVDRLKQEFLANMSHELRTPLNSIIGYSEVLLDGVDGDLTEDAVEDVEAIYVSGKHLLSIINEILDLAKIDAGQLELRQQEKNIVEILRHIVNSSQVLVKDKAVDIILAEGEPVMMAYIDPVRLNQILLNLVGNAIKFTEEGSVTVNYGLLDENTIRIEIIDTGIGMDAEQLSLIFERFRQVDGSSTRRAGGTGLGLTITRQLVEMHGGEIGVTSEVDKGSVFFFTLPTLEHALELEAQDKTSEMTPSGD